MRNTANETEHQTLLRLMRAMDRRQPVTITYLKADGTETVRTIETHNIEVSAAGDILLKTMDRQSGEKRTFRLDRIRAYTIHFGTYQVELPADTKPATPKAFCPGCADLVDADDMGPDVNGDPACTDCLATWAGIAEQDAADHRAYAYH